MAEWQGTITTTAGKNLLAKMLALKERITFTKVVLGDGELSPEESEYSLTDLISPKLNLPLKSSEIIGDGTAKIVFLLSNQNLATGFNVREIGVFAIDPDIGEILFQYDNAGDKNDWMPAGSAINTINRFANIFIGIQDTKDIALNIDTSLLFATEEELQDHINNTTMHIQRASQTASPSSLWAQEDSDGKAHPLSIDNARTAILGDSASTIPVLTGRVSQLEIEQSNILLQMQAQTDLPTSNLGFAEDFNNPDKIDTFNVQVKSVVAGDNGIDVETLTGLIPGAWYWITDGINQEYIQIDSCIKNGSIYRILAHTDKNAVIQNTYNVADTKIYRTTSNISSGTAYGAGDKKGFNWQPNLVWKGVNANVASTITLETTQSNADQFTQSGDVAFTADGLFTIAS